MNYEAIKSLLDYKAQEYETLSFIDKDPIIIPKQFSTLQDIEISGFFAAILAWGNRTSIINSLNRLMDLLEYSPYQFVTQHKESDLKPMMSFIHRTFNATDLIYTINFLKHHYTNNESLECAFINGENIRERLINFHNYFFSLQEYPERTRKHISTPFKNSACKRINMYLRWMVRKESPVDFGLWDSIPQSSLMIPLDVHTGNVARRLNLLERKQNDWKSVEMLTDILRLFNPHDPARYDFALFGLGAEERYR